MHSASTLGLRIQEERRCAGLSQEALGERLGVSRQAVGKWEADAAIPELEKLIAMSRIFGLSVGQLLGVEPAAGQSAGNAAPSLTDDADAPAPAEGAAQASCTDTGGTPEAPLSPRELAAAEAIAAKYLAAFRRSRRPRGWRLVLCLLAGILCAGVLIALGSRLVQTGQQVEQLGRKVDQLQRELTQNVSGLSGQIRTILSENSYILYDSSVEIQSISLEAQTVTLRVSASVKEWSADTTGIFTLTLSDGRTLQTDAVRKDGVFSAEGWIVPMDDTLAVTIVLTEETRSRSALVDTLYSCSPDALRLQVTASLDTSWSSSTNEVRLQNLNLYIASDSPYSISPTAVDLCLYRNQETTPEQVQPVKEAAALWQESGMVSMSAFSDYGFRYQLAPGDTVVAVIRTTDDLGQTTYTVLNAFGADAEGKVAEKDSKGDWNDYIWKPGYTIR